MLGGGGLSPPSWHPSASLSSRLDGPLPTGVRVDGDTLGFPPLTAEHSGTYVCHVSNELSSRDSQVTVEVLGKHQADRTWAETGSRERGWAAGLGGRRAGRPPQTAAWPRRPPGRLPEAGGPGVGLGGGGGCHRRAPALPPGGRGAAHVSVPPAQGPADDAEIVSPPARHTGRGRGQGRGQRGPPGCHLQPPPAPAPAPPSPRTRPQLLTRASLSQRGGADADQGELHPEAALPPRGPQEPGVCCAQGRSGGALRWAPAQGPFSTGAVPLGSCPSTGPGPGGGRGPGSRLGQAAGAGSREAEPPSDRSPVSGPRSRRRVWG